MCVLEKKKAPAASKLDTSQKSLGWGGVGKKTIEVGLGLGVSKNKSQSQDAYPYSKRLKQD